MRKDFLHQYLQVLIRGGNEYSLTKEDIEIVKGRAQALHDMGGTYWQPVLEHIQTLSEGTGQKDALWQVLLASDR
jgi:hypothetical protein